MSNPLYNALNQPTMMGEFQNFVRQMQGINPAQEINRLVQTGKISPQQLNEAQRQAQQLMGMFGRK